MGHDVPSPKTKVRRNMKKILLTERATCETTFDSHMATTPSATCDMEIPTSATRDLPCTEELQPAGVHLVIALLTVLILILVKQLVDISEEVVKLANELRDLKFKQRKVVERKRNSVSTIAATTAPDQLKLD
jgi:hypothetical protein